MGDTCCQMKQALIIRYIFYPAKDRIQQSKIIHMLRDAVDAIQVFQLVRTAHADLLKRR